MGLELVGILIVVAVAGVMTIPVVLSRRIEHGEARFESRTNRGKDDGRAARRGGDTGNGDADGDDHGPGGRRNGI